jgi:hypothetical protein
MNNGHHNIIEYCTIGPGRNYFDFEGFRVGPDATYNWVHHCTLFGYGEYTDGRQRGDMFYVGDSPNPGNTHHNLIEDNHMHSGGHNVFSVNARNNVVRNNYFHNEKWYPLSNPTYGYRISEVRSEGGGWNLFEGNRYGFTDPPPTKPMAKAIQGTSNNNIFRRNMIYGIKGGGLQLATNNEHPSPKVDDNYVYNNVFFDIGQPGVSDIRAKYALLIQGRSSISGTVVKNNIFFENLEGYGTSGTVTNIVEENNWKSGDPLFVDAEKSLLDPSKSEYPDFRLRSGSGCINAGAFLTTTRSSGSGTQIPVQDAHYFFDGWGMTDDIPDADLQGDLIQLEGQIQRARITNINYDTNTITVDTTLSWSSGIGVSLAYEGLKPDMGAFEYGEGGGSSCDCTSWQNSQCGGGTCPSDQMQQARSCNPSDCNSESRCIADSSCGTPHPPNTYVAIKTSSLPVIDGDIEEFEKANSIDMSNTRGTAGNYAIMWDDNAIYIGAAVSDDQLNAVITQRDAAMIWRDDSIELLFDTLHDAGSDLKPDDYKVFVNVRNVQREGSLYSSSNWDADFLSVVKETGTINDNTDSDEGYSIEFAIPWSEWLVPKPSIGDEWGFDFSLNDRDMAGIRTSAFWANTDGGDPNNPDGWGDLIFTHRADSSPGYGCIGMNELISFSDLWKSPATDVSMPELMEAIGLWKGGQGCI